jgi:uncharacterized lipoprotein YbaY
MPAIRTTGVLGWAMVASTLLLVACGQSTDDPMLQQPHVVRGMAVLEAPAAALSTDSRLLAELIDVGVSGEGGGGVVATQELKPAGQSPLPFELRYQPSGLREEAALAVRVTVFEDDQALFVTPEPAPVDRRLASDVVEVGLVAAPSVDGDSEPPAEDDAEEART